MKILIAADGSKFTRQALKYLIEHLKMFGPKPEVHVLHVQPRLQGRAAAFLARSAVQRHYDDETNKALASARRVLEKAGIGFKELHAVGDPGELIAEQACRGKYSLIVMGSHGHGMIASLVLGSTASKVLANCKIPALIVR
jgi:nucleotide-binding universal stress UspA family protein